MSNQNYATVLTTPTATNYYEGAAGLMPGGTGLAASVLFSVVGPVGAPQYIASNRDVPNSRGWAISLLDAPANPILQVEVGDGATMNATAIGDLPLGMLALVHLVQAAPGQVDVYINGNLVSGPAVTGLASALSPTVLAREGGADPAGAVQLLGVAYGLVPPVMSLNPSLATLHYQNCQRYYDMAPLTATGATVAGGDFAHRWSARDGAVDPGVIPPVAAATWEPSAGTDTLARQGDGQSPATTTLTNPAWISQDV